jgi:Condensation domain.
MNSISQGIHDQTSQLGSLEELLWLYGEVSPFHFVMGAEFKGIGHSTPWRDVLDALQARHPMLRMRVKNDANGLKTFVSDDAARIPLRIGDAGLGWSGEMSQELRTRFDLSRAPLIRAVVIPGADSSTLLLTVHHSIADGIALTIAFRDVLQLLSGMALEALPCPVSQDEMLGGQLRGAPASGGDAYPTPTENDSSFRDRLEVQHRVFSADLTRAIAEKSRAEGTTLFGALTAATIIAGRSLSDRWRAEALKLLCPVSSRQHAAHPDVIRTYFNIIPLQVDPTYAPGFWEMARYCRDSVLPAQSREMAREISGQISGLLATGLTPSAASDFMYANFASHGSVSNLGVIPYESRAGDVELTAMLGGAFSTGVDGEQYICAVTINEKLQLTNTSSRPISGLLATVEAVLVEACL